MERGAGDMPMESRSEEQVADMSHLARTRDTTKRAEGGMSTLAKEDRRQQMTNNLTI